MAAIASLLLLLSVSFVVLRVASVALAHTGMSRESARFQARSAFMGVGFTTHEAESVAGHPVRRRIVMWLMLWGNIGLVTFISSGVLSLDAVHQADPATKIHKLAVLAVGAVGLILLAHSRFVDKHLSRAIGWLLERTTSIDVRDYTSLLELEGDYRVSELFVQPGDWVAEKTLAELQLRDEGILVLGIQHEDGAYFGAPRGLSRVAVGDTLILYGRAEAVSSLDERMAGSEGDRQHDQRCAAQRELLEAESSTSTAGA